MIVKARPRCERGRAFVGAIEWMLLLYGIVHELGGEVGVESWIGEGSTFSFTLPLAQ